MDVFEKRFFQDKILKRIELTVRKNSVSINDLRKVIVAMKIRIHETDIRRSAGETTEKIIFYVYIPIKLDPQLLLFGGDDQLTNL